MNYSYDRWRAGAPVWRDAHRAAERRPVERLKRSDGEPWLSAAAWSLVLQLLGIVAILGIVASLGAT